MIKLLFLLLLLFSSLAHSKSWDEEVFCGSSIINVGISEKEEGIKIWEVELNIKSKFQKTVMSTLKYEQVYFRYSCEKTSNGKDYFVYQAHCSGTGCSDSQNWGVVNNYGKLLLVPYNENSVWKQSILKNN